jgi:hypothetical protein
MPVPQFKKIGSSCADLLKKKFDFDNELKVITNADGLKLEVTGSDAGGKGLAGHAVVTYKDKSFGELEAKLHTSDKAKDTTVKLKLNQLNKGTDVTLNTDSDLNANVEVNHVQDNVAASATLSLGGVNASLCIGSDGYTIGGSAVTDASHALKDYNVGVQYAAKDLTLAVTTAKSMNNVNVSFWNRYCGGIQWGAAMQLHPSVGGMTLGAEKVVDKSTILKIKGGTDYKVSTAVEHRLENLFKINLAAAFDTSKGNFNATNFGIGLTFGDY